MSDQGEPTGVPCPKLCGGGIVYNGNYFCVACGWRAPDDWSASIDQALLVECLAGLIIYRRAHGFDTTREELYLPFGHELRTHKRSPHDEP